jgi:signal transduction histidine kinase
MAQAKARVARRTPKTSHSSSMEESLHVREDFLATINEMTRAILLSNDYASTMQIIVSDMKKIIGADDCYIVRWNEETQLPIPITAELDFPFTEAALHMEEVGITVSIMRVGHVIAIDDVYHSPHIPAELANRFPARSIIGIPLIAADQKLGVVIIAFNSLHSFTQDEIDRAEQAGNQVALALLKFQQNVEIQRRLRESNALTEISRALSETERVGSDKVLQLIVDSALNLIQQAEESVIHLVDLDSEALIPKAISGFESRSKTSTKWRIGLKQGVAGHVMETGETVNIGDIRVSPLYMVKGMAPSYRSLMVAPVHSEGKPIGTLSVQSNQVNAFSGHDVELLNALSIQAAIAIENTRLFENIQQRLKEVNALYRTSRGLAASMETDQLFKDVVSLLQQNFGYYHVQMYLLDFVTGDYVLKAASGAMGAKMLAQSFHLPRGIGIVGYVTETAAPFVTNNVNDVVFFYRNPLLPDTQSELTVPIKLEGKVVGVLDIQQTPPHRLTNGDLELMMAVADQLSVALQRVGLYENLENALQQEKTIRSQLLQNERLALVGRLLASVSHELNNPLQAIQNALFLLRDEATLSTQGQQDLDIILAETERMATLIERLRSAYRPIRIKDFQLIQLNTLLEDVHTLIATHMRHKQIAFEFIPEPSLPNIPGISDQIRQVALNLFLNAVEIMQPGGRLTVQTCNLPEQKEVLFIVRDTGPGIDAEILPRIFEPFITSKHTGTGLGLTITRDIIEQHHGHISADNHPGGGAIFRVWLPVDEAGEE